MHDRGRSRRRTLRLSRRTGSGISRTSVSFVLVVSSKPSGTIGTSPGSFTNPLAIERLRQAGRAGGAPVAASRTSVLFADLRADQGPYYLHAVQ